MASDAESHQTKNHFRPPCRPLLTSRDPDGGLAAQVVYPPLERGPRAFRDVRNSICGAGDLPRPAETDAAPYFLAGGAL